MPLAGLQDEFSGELTAPGGIDLSVGPSMFDTLGRPPNTQPSQEAIAQQFEQVQVDRKTEFKEVVVRTYDLGDEVQREQYQLDMEHIFLGLQLRTHALLNRTPLQFINDEKGPRYIAHMQWIEFRLLEKPVPKVGSTE